MKNKAFLILLTVPLQATSFIVLHARSKTTFISSSLPMANTEKSDGDNMNTPDPAVLPDPMDMRIKEIKTELDNLQVSYADCFDKDSLCTKLIDARIEMKSNSNGSTKQRQESDTKGDERPPIDMEGYADSIRDLRVKELKTMLAERGIRWGTMKEKSEMIQALVSYQEKAATFSRSGKLVPGKVGDIDGETLQKELEPGSATPLLLDVYAVWCGPCKMMAPELEQAAASLGNRCRVAKIDSDKFPEWGSKLKVAGLPSVIVFNGNGDEVDRVEGAMTNTMLTEFAERHM